MTDLNDHDDPAADPVAAAEAPVELTDAQVESWILSSRPRRGWIYRHRRGLLTLMMLLALVLVLLPSGSDMPGRELAGLGLLLAAMVIGWRLTRQTQLTLARYRQTLAAMQMRQWPAASALLGRLMSDPIDSPEMRSVVLLWLAELAGRAGRHDAAVAALDEVLSINTVAQYHQSAMAEKALALLRAHRLTDATALLDGLRSMDLVEPVASLAEVGQLYRRIQTRNYAAVIAEADALAARAREVFHPQAAHVYALIALAFEQVGNANRAQAYYECATLLMSPAELARRFSELGPLADRLAPARSPL